MNKNPIGIFDSGIGGISLVYEIKKSLPNESIIYLADKANFPYGEKTPAQIKKIVEKNAKWLLKQNVKIVVVACNTATVNAISFLRNKFPSISFVGMEPAIKPAGRISKKGVIILSSPKATKSKQLHNLISKHAKDIKVFNIGCLKLVQAVEEHWSSDKIKKILKSSIPQKILGQADTLILGCTHFPLIKNQVQKYVGNNIKVIDSGEAVVRRIKEVLKEKGLLNTKTKVSYKYITTGESEIVKSVNFKKVDI